MNANPGSFDAKERRWGGFTLAELLVVMAAIALMATILLPALAGTKEKSRLVECRSNVREICAAISIYAKANNDFMPPLKWRDPASGSANTQYPYEMFRYSPVGVTPPTYDADGGPYNLGVLWTSGILTDGKVFYCPAQIGNNIWSYNYYAVKREWPWGVDPAVANANYVRAGYTYYPQSRNTQTLRDLGTPSGTGVVPVWPSYNTSPPPLKTWICVPLFKQTDINPKKSVVVDIVTGNLSQIPHKDLGAPIGLNAGFGDGHVNWQGVKFVKDGFDPNVWALIIGNTKTCGDNWQYVMSCWRP